MGNTVPRQAGTLGNIDQRSLFQGDLPNFIYEKQIGDGKFMKAHRLKMDGVLVVVKVYMSAIEEVLIFHYF